MVTWKIFSKVISCWKYFVWLDYTIPYVQTIFMISFNTSSVNSSPPSAAYMLQWISSTLVQMMACRLFDAKPLSKPMLGYGQLDPYEQTSVKFQSKYKTFHSWNASEYIICKIAAILSIRCQWECLIYKMGILILERHVKYWNDPKVMMKTSAASLYCPRSIFTVTLSLHSRAACTQPCN